MLLSRVMYEFGESKRRDRLAVTQTDFIIPVMNFKNFVGKSESTILLEKQWGI